MLIRNVFEQLIGLYAANYPKQFLPDSLKNIDASKLTADIFTNSKLTSVRKIQIIIRR